MHSFPTFLLQYSIHIIIYGTLLTAIIAGFNGPTIYSPLVYIYSFIWMNRFNGNSKQIKIISHLRLNLIDKLKCNYFAFVFFERLFQRIIFFSRTHARTHTHVQFNNALINSYWQLFNQMCFTFQLAFVVIISLLFLSQLNW